MVEIRSLISSNCLSEYLTLPPRFLFSNSPLKGHRNPPDLSEAAESLSRACYSNCPLAMNLAPLPHPNDEPPGEIRPGGPTLLSVREGFFIAKRFLGINELSFLLASHYSQSTCKPSLILRLKVAVQSDGFRRRTARSQGRILRDWQALHFLATTWRKCVLMRGTLRFSPQTPL